MTLGGDVVSRIKSVASFYATSNSRGWVSIWKPFVGSHSSSNDPTYDAQEEERMLGNLELEDDLEKFESDSSHHVHFRDETTENRNPNLSRGNSDETIAVSPTRSVSNSRSHSHSRSPSSTNTLFESLQETNLNHLKLSNFGISRNGNESIGLFRDWRANQRQHEERRLQNGSAKTSESSTLKNVARYTRVVLARSLPILAFVASYSGLAVYTGSCRGGYQVSRQDSAESTRDSFAKSDRFLTDVN